MDDQSLKPPTSFLVISIVALLWNIMGVIAFAGQMMMDDAMLATLPEAQRAIVEATPSWLLVLFGIATVGGMLGCILLLMRKSQAIQVFLVSLIAVILQMGYSWVMTDTIAAYGTLQGVIMPAVVIIIAAFLYWYSKEKTAEGLLI